MNQVHLCDCMEFMKDIPDKHYELAIVDPPYGIGRDGQSNSLANKHNPRHGGKKYFKQKGWDKTTPKKEYFDELFRISENQIIFGANYFTKYIPPSMGWIFWDKMQRGFNSDGELAFSSFSKALKVVEIQRGVLAYENTIHPTQKPVALYKWLLSNYAKQGDKIFDSHVGSGSIRIACHDMGFDFEGCEIDKDYWEAQEERYKVHSAQSELFAPKELQAQVVNGDLFASRGAK